MILVITISQIDRPFNKLAILINGSAVFPLSRCKAFSVRLLLSGSLLLFMELKRQCSKIAYSASIARGGISSHLIRSPVFAFAVL
jgi:hypothetical protein